MKIELFEEISLESLKYYVNLFIKDKQNVQISISTYTYSYGSYSTVKYIACVVYKE